MVPIIQEAGQWVAHFAAIPYIVEEFVVATVVMALYMFFVNSIDGQRVRRTLVYILVCWSLSLSMQYSVTHDPSLRRYVFSSIPFVSFTLGLFTAYAATLLSDHSVRLRRIPATAVSVVAVAFLVGCIALPTVTPDVPPTEVGLSTDVPNDPTETVVVPPSTATDAPTATGDETPTQIYPSPSPSGDNLLDNGGFDEPYTLDNGGQFDITQVLIAYSWRAFYAGTPYTPDPVLAPLAGTKNPVGLLMRRPEFTPTFASDHPERVRSGDTVQRWFCFFATCDAGVYQTVSTTPGVVYEVGAWFQLWSEDGKHPLDDFGNIHDSHTFGYQQLSLSEICEISGDAGTSDTCSEDDRGNALAYISVNLSGDTFAFSESNLPAVREYHGFDEGCIDGWCLVTYRFTANAASTTVFFGSLRNFPFEYNDTYLDDAYVRRVSP